MWLHNARTSKPHYQEISINSAKSITCIDTVAVPPDPENRFIPYFLDRDLPDSNAPEKKLLLLQFI